MKLVLLALLALPAAAQQESYNARPLMIRPGGILLFYTAEGPLSLQAMTPKEIPADLTKWGGEVFTKGCQYGVSVPLSLTLQRQSLSGVWGKGGLEKAVDKLKHDRPDILGLYDVKIDLHLTRILGIWTRQCVEIAGRGLVKA